MRNIDLINDYHRSTKRDYIGRVLSADKADCAEIAKKFDQDYWDGDRKFGYGGYKYDGRWNPVAKKLIDAYQLTSQSKVLDVGCGKGFLLFELTQLLPGISVHGLDISRYAIEQSKPEIRDRLIYGDAKKLPFDDQSFDLVFSINTIHNLQIETMWNALQEIERVGKNKHITVEAFRNEREKMNLLYWQITCRAFYAPEDWKFLFKKIGYTGDYGFITFE